jgi:hypothetical protein
MKRLLFALLFTSSLFAQDLTGVFAPGETYEAPAEHAPANVSRMFVRTAKTSVDLPATGGSGMLITTTAGARLTTPTGDVLRPRENGSLDRGVRRFHVDAKSDVIHIERTEPGNYRLDVDAPALVVAAEPDSPIALETWITPLSRQPGEPVTLFAKLTGEIGNARVTARAGGNAIELTEKDGIYSATLPDFTGIGLQQVRFEADGETRDGVRFARNGTSEFVAERGAARLGAIHASRVNGAVRVKASADVVIPGAYRFDVIVASNGTALAWGEGVRQLERGANELVLDVPVANAGELLLDVRLLGLDTIGVAGRATVELHPRTETIE